MKFRSRGYALASLALLLAGSPGYAEDIPASAVIFAKPPPAKPSARRPRDFSATVAVAPAGTRAPEEAEVLDPYTSIGRAFDPVQGRAMDDACVESSTGKDEPFGGGSISDHDRKIVSDEKSYANVSSSSVGASVVIKAVSLGFGTSSASASVFNSVDQFARVYYRVAVDGSERRNVKWTGRAERLLKSGRSSDLATFLKECGTRYIRAVYKGHLLDTTVVFQMREKQTSASSSFDLSVGVKGVFDVSGGSSDAQDKVSQLAYVDLQSHGRGQFATPQAGTSPVVGAGGQAGTTRLTANADEQTSTSPADGANPPKDAKDKPSNNAKDKPPADAQQPGPGGSASAGAGATIPAAQGTSKLEQLIAWYETGFEQAVLHADKATAKPLYVTVERYVDKTRLPYLDRIPRWPDGIYAAIEAKAEVYNDLVTAIADIASTISADPNNTRLATFYVDDLATAKDKRDKAKALLESFRSALQTCEGYINDGKERDAGGNKVVDLCAKQLNDTLSATKVDAVRLQRKYS